MPFEVGQIEDAQTGQRAALTHLSTMRGTLTKKSFLQLP
jgi:hypothetical protein